MNQSTKRRTEGQEDAIMDWTTLWVIETVIAFLGVFSLHWYWS